MHVTSATLFVVLRSSRFFLLGRGIRLQGASVDWVGRVRQWDRSPALWGDAWRNRRRMHAYRCMGLGWRLGPRARATASVVLSFLSSSLILLSPPHKVCVCVASFVAAGEPMSGSLQCRVI
jgi:hypothetical protein